MPKLLQPKDKVVPFLKKWLYIFSYVEAFPGSRAFLQTKAAYSQVHQRRPQTWRPTGKVCRGLENGQGCMVEATTGHGPQFSSPSFQYCWTCCQRIAAPEMKGTTIATMNVNHLGVAKIPEITTVMNTWYPNNGITGTWCQQLYSCPGYVDKFRKAGVNALLGSLSSKNLCRVALASTLPIRPIVFSDISQSDRYVAGVVDSHRYFCWKTFNLLCVCRCIQHTTGKWFGHRTCSGHESISLRLGFDWWLQFGTNRSSFGWTRGYWSMQPPRHAFWTLGTPPTHQPKQGSSDWFWRVLQKLRSFGPLSFSWHRRPSWCGIYCRRRYTNQGPQVASAQPIVAHLHFSGRKQFSQHLEW